MGYRVCEGKPRFVRSDVKIGPCLPQESKFDLNSLVSATKEGVSLAEVDTQWQLRQQKQDLTLMDEVDADAYEKRRASCVSSDVDQPGPILHLRSPEGILFYLGELTRVEHNFNRFPSVCIGDQLWPLFVALAEKGDRSVPACKIVSVAVKYAGTEFIIPDRVPRKEDIATPGICSGLSVRPTSGIPASQASAKRDQQKIIEGKDLNCFGGMSMESFSLLTQLIALQKTAKDVPTTSVVRAIVQ
ncbi:MAG TPA: hypothetical protein VH988_31815 [Thermoanaerobaculia bacterium]|jgi:hypothetical protein|nr:hypothetical protein [Thermoanaerobaculia bacterium]